MNMTLEQKQDLEAFLETGYLVAEVAYDPTLVVGTPEANAIAAGYTEYLRNDTTYLVEVIYTIPLVTGNPQLQQFTLSEYLATGLI